MTIQTINDYKNKFIISNYSFFTDIFTKPIWGDMGEDTASITLTVMENTWTCTSSAPKAVSHIH